MNKFVKLMLATAAMVGISTAASAQFATKDSLKGKTLVIGTEAAYPPFEYRNDKNEIIGWEIDYANMVCDKLKASHGIAGCKIEDLPFDGLIAALEAKKIDMIMSSMSITEERMKKIAFSEKYYNTPARWVFPKTKTINPDDKAQLKGLNIGVQEGTTHMSFLEGEYADVVTVKPYASQDLANEDLVNGRIDGILADSIVMFEWMTKNPNGSNYEFKGEPQTVEKYFGKGAGAGIRKVDTELVSAVNAAIAETIKDGSWDKNNEKYFPFSIY